MGIAEQHDIPKKPEEKSEWSVRRLFPMAAVTSAVAKTFTNPFDILLGYLVLIIGLAELFGRHVSWFMWVFTTLILAADLYQRKSILSDVKPEGSPKEK